MATPPNGLEADVLVVTSFQDLDAKASQARGKIVLFNVPYTTYGETVQYRSGGAVAAARHGAVASFVRAVGPMGLRTPHTGNMSYADAGTKIPTAADRRRGRQPHPAADRSRDARADTAAHGSAHGARRGVGQRVR